MICSRWLRRAVIFADLDGRAGESPTVGDLQDLARPAPQDIGAAVSGHAPLHALPVGDLALTHSDAVARDGERFAAVPRVQPEPARLDLHEAPLLTEGAVGGALLDERAPLFDFEYEAAVGEAQGVPTFGIGMEAGVCHVPSGA